MSYCQRCTDLEYDNKLLRIALLAHRADLHNYSKRPCPTCRFSAEVLGLRGKVPDCCALAETDGTTRDAQGNPIANRFIDVRSGNPVGHETEER